MKVTYCDIPGCHEEAYNTVDSCVGYTKSIDSKKIAPFDRPRVDRIDLCPKHYRMWLEATYKAFFKITED